MSDIGCGCDAVSGRLRAEVLLDYADLVHGVEEPVSGLLGDWEAWRHARRVREHAGVLLGGAG